MYDKIVHFDIYFYSKLFQNITMSSIEDVILGSLQDVYLFFSLPNEIDKFSDDQVLQVSQNTHIILTYL